MKDATFNVRGMSCGHCKAAVEGELNGLPGVERSNAEIGDGTVEVTYDEDRVGADRLVRAIEDAGYTVAV